MIQANNKQLRGVNRTICVGLGGTGRDVLMRIRRLIVDRHGDLSRLPIVSFVHIDTDKAAAQVAGLREGSIYHGVDLSFREVEKVSAVMSATQVNNFVQGLENRSSYERQSPYDHIGLWFPQKMLRNIKAIEEGAKGIRPVGRLAFFHNYRKIQAAIQAAEQRTRGHEGELIKEGLVVDQRLSIFVVASLCGGTGSGMFLDIAYSLKRLYGDDGAEIIGYLVISPQLYGNAPSMNANTYAALKELNYYSTPGTCFEACYDMQEMVLVRDEKRPPFDYTYLVSNQTAGAYQVLEQGKLCNVIAHKIALDFSGELSPVVKGMRDNFMQHMIPLDNHPRPNVQSYLTFGLAAIYFPRDRIVQVALARITLKLLTFWLNGEGQSPDPQLLLEQFLIEFRWHDDLTKKDGLSERLSKSVLEANKTFRDAINIWRSRLEQEILDCRNRDSRSSLQQRLLTEFRTNFRKTQPGETEATRGVWLTRLKEMKPDVLIQLKADIQNYLVNLLTPSNSSFGIKNSRDWLDSLQTELNNYQYSLEEQIKEFGGFRTQDDLEKLWRDTKQVTDILEKTWELPFLKIKNHQIQDEIKGAVQRACDLMKHNFELVVAQESLFLVKELQKYVQERLTQVSSFVNLVDTLRANYEREESSLRQLNFDEMSGEAIFNDKDVESCYNILLPQQECRAQLVLLSSEIIGLSNSEQSLVGLVEQNRISQEQLRKEINLRVDSSFGSRSTNIVKSVIKRFIQNYPLSSQSVRLGQIMEEGEPLLRLNLDDAYFRSTESKSSKLIGFRDTDEAEVIQFKAALTRDLGISETTLKPTQAEDEILIVTEYAGFPLRLIHNLEYMKTVYLREKNYIQEQNSSSSFLHIDNREMFTDIIPPDARLVEQVEDVFYPCLALEILKENPQNYQIEFDSFDSLRNTYYPFCFSANWNQAIETLIDRPDLLELLDQVLEENITTIRNQPKLWSECYLPLLRRFVDRVEKITENDVNYPCKSTIIGTKMTREVSAKEGVIERFFKRMQKYIPPELPSSK